MKRLLASFLCGVLSVSVFAGDNSYKVTYDGGSLPDIKAGTAVKLYIDSNQIRLVRDKTDVITVPASAVTDGEWALPSALLLSRLGSERSWR